MAPKVFYTRDSHPVDHSSFQTHGGPWPVHCVKGTPGWEFHDQIPLVKNAQIIDKGSDRTQEAYSGFEETTLAENLRHQHVHRVLIAGLVTEYCVMKTALDAAKLGLETWVLLDAIAPVEATPGDGQRAIVRMKQAQVQFSDTKQIRIILGKHWGGTALLLVDLQRDFFPGGALPAAAAPRVIEPLRNFLAQVAP